MLMRTHTNGQNCVGGWTRPLMVASGAALALAAGFSVSAAQRGDAPPPADPGSTMGTIGFFFDSGSTAEWLPPAELRAQRIIISQTSGIGDSDSRGWHVDIPAVVEYTRSLIERAGPEASEFVLVNDSESDLLETIFLETAMNPPGAEHPEWAAAVDEHVRLLNALHEAMPAHRFALYARPRLPAWVHPTQPGRWDEMESSRFMLVANGYARAYEPIMSASGWLCPQSVYDAYDDSDPRSRDAVTEWGDDHAGATRAGAFNCVAFCRERYPDTPCIPFVTPYFTNSHFATPFRPIPSAEFLSQQVEPCLDAGATGICVYTGLEWVLRMACTSMDSRYDEYRAWFESAYFPPSWGPVDWSDPQTRTYLQPRIEEHTLAALGAVRDALDSIPPQWSEPASVGAVDRELVVERAVSTLRSLPVTFSGNTSPVENVWEEIKVQVQEQDSVEGGPHALTIRQAIEDALVTTPRLPVQASARPTGDRSTDGEELIDDLARELLGRARDEEINFAPLEFEYFTFQVDHVTVYAGVLARTGSNMVRVRGYSVAAPNGEEGEVSIDRVERIITAKEFESARSAIVSPRTRARPTAPAAPPSIRGALARNR